MNVSNTKPRRERKRKIVSVRVDDTMHGQLLKFFANEKQLSAGQAVRRIVQDVIKGDLVRTSVVPQGSPKCESGHENKVSCQI